MNDREKIEAAICRQLNLPTDHELTEDDLSRVTSLSLSDNQITDVTPLSALTSLTSLYLWGNKITDVTALRAALPKCEIYI